MEKYSKNKKLNAVLNEIREQLLSIGYDESEARNEIKRYMREFPREEDFNLAQYGNVLVYYSQVYEMYERCGYISMSKLSSDKIWEIYKRQVGWVARKIMEEK